MRIGEIAYIKNVNGCKTIRKPEISLQELASLCVGLKILVNINTFFINTTTTGLLYF